MTERRIGTIRIGTRHRREVGDLRSLAASIAELGLLHPVVIKPDGELIAGERRLKACQSLGWESVPVTIVNMDNVTRGELAENTERAPFLPSEIEAIRRALTPLVATPEGRPPKTKETFLSNERGQTRDKIGVFAGISGRTVEKIAAVCAAAEAEPERFGRLQADMDRTGKVDSAFKLLKIARAREAYDARKEQGGTVADLVALAHSGFRAGAILVDCPWPFETWGGESGKILTSPENHYKSMTIEEIKAFGEQYVLPLAANNCALFFWVTWPQLFAAKDVLETWRFKYSSDGFLWVKLNPNGEGLYTGNGYLTRSNTEPCLLATRGHPLRLALDVHQVILTPVRGHSEKPDEAHARIERLVAGPYLELFARRPRAGWVTWGDELPPPVAEPAESSPESERTFRYVRHEDVEAFEAEGWQRRPALDGTHHGEHAALMERNTAATESPTDTDDLDLPDCLRREQRAAPAE